ncbi:thiol:disulfide interchange protein DsbA/DsbL [Helicobacter sp. 11S03491-1]|uniref:thiol:disulfide interchange protein DsbA/DsbL n=1 Tax=Helicobacter sp. 11S03491-1 TaxID=1476196 RepID=UPI000BA70C35|nr:thiol:disulfide interchange protein DsbA/DsbL [Helicobacter sp. 11S03491-1]PAF43833.1 thiol:disulfide interchange protein [Helicobacter sp. 11S03491-1]
MKESSLLTKFSRLIGIAVLFGSISLHAAKEGTEYMVLPDPVPNAQNSVIEVFSYDCPFCFKYSKIVPKIVKDLPKGVAFKPFHLKTKGKYGVQASELFAVLAVKDQKNGIDINSDASLFHKAEYKYFDEYHVKKNRWKDGADPQSFLKTGLDAVGMSESEFNAEKSNPAVLNLLKTWDISYEIAKIQGVPAFVVNGKYLIYTKSIRSIDHLEQIINDLLKM